MAGAKATREAVRTLFLEAPSSLKLPSLITGEPSKTLRPQGGNPVHANIESGSLFLRKGHEHFRVCFDSKVEPPRLDAGMYKAFGYRVRRVAEDGSKWFISTAGARGTPIAVPPEDGTAKVELEISASVLTDLRVKKTEKGFNITLAIRGDGLAHKPTMTVYKDGKRVPARYEVFDENGRKIGSGSLDYG